MFLEGDLMNFLILNGIKKCNFVICVAFSGIPLVPIKTTLHDLGGFFILFNPLLQDLLSSVESEVTPRYICAV